ncbi:hypothetical protein JCM15519_00920 [Fundidesulfovibrio butyratiphilus]
MAHRLKARVRRAFGQAQAYDAHASVQSQAAESLARRAVDAGLAPGGHVFEIGCGTGALALRLSRLAPPARLVCADLSPGMLIRARTNLAGLRPTPLLAAMDAEHLAVKPGFDAVVSCMALQWTIDLAATVAGLWRLVRPGGLLAFCLPGRGTFASWSQAHRECGLCCGLHDFPGEADLAAMLPQAAAITAEDRPMYFENAREFPRHLKAIGATVPRPGSAPLGPAQFRSVLAALDRAYPDGPVVAYRLLYALAVKPEKE